MSPRFATPRARAQSNNALSVLESAIQTFPSSLDSTRSQTSSTTTSDTTATSRKLGTATLTPTTSTDQTATSNSVPTRTRTSTTRPTLAPSKLSTVTKATTVLHSAAVDVPASPTSTSTTLTLTTTVGAHPSKYAWVAGVIAGLLAIIAVAGICIIYSRRQKKAGRPLFPFARKASQHSSKSGPYPQSAWLYDPVRTPGSGRSRDRPEDQQNLIPDPRTGSVEMDTGTASPDFRSSRGASLDIRGSSPSMRKARASSPGHREFSAGRASTPLLSLPRITIEDDDGVGGIEQAYERLNGGERDWNLGSWNGVSRSRGGGGIDEDGGA